MKTFVVGYRLFSVTLIVSLSLFFTTGCQDPLEEKDSTLNPTDEYQGVENWQELLPDILNPNGIIVTNQSSIQEAIDAAEPGGAIYIEPGVYTEALTIDKPDIALIGLTGAQGEEVVLENPGKIVKGIEVEQGLQGIEVRNITLRNFADNSLPALTSSARKLLYLRSFNRDVEYGNIAHYQFDVQVGDGPFGVVRIHRVVQESRPYHPIRTQGDVLMIHGAFQDFDDIFLTAGNGLDERNSQTSSPIYLASQGIDVWGIDLAWTKVPAETQNFGFMSEWGIDRDANDVLKSMAIARLIRGLTRNGFGKMNLLGFSYGVGVAYMAAGLETQRPRFFRSINGLIPADGLLKYDPTHIGGLGDANPQPIICGQVADNNTLLENARNGVFADGEGNIIGAFNSSFNPPPIPPVVLGSFPQPAPAPGWHFVAGKFDGEGNVTGLAFTDEQRWNNLLNNPNPVSNMPILTLIQYRQSLCGQDVSIIEENLGDIAIPIHYLGAGGGSGDFGLYTASLTASQDISSDVVKITSNPPTDFGHADLWMANNAPELVWEPLRLWLLDH